MAEKLSAESDKNEADFVREAESRERFAIGRVGENRGVTECLEGRPLKKLSVRGTDKVGRAFADLTTGWK
jgi:hypothetical protein